MPNVIAELVALVTKCCGQEEACLVCAGAVKSLARLCLGTLAGTTGAGAHVVAADWPDPSTSTSLTASSLPTIGTTLLEVLQSPQHLLSSLAADTLASLLSAGLLAPAAVVTAVAAAIGGSSRVSMAAGVGALDLLLLLVTRDRHAITVEQLAPLLPLVLKEVERNRDRLVLHRCCQCVRHGLLALTVCHERLAIIAQQIWELAASVLLTARKDVQRQCVILSVATSTLNALWQVRPAAGAADFLADDGELSLSQLTASFESLVASATDMNAITAASATASTIMTISTTKNPQPPATVPARTAAAVLAEENEEKAEEEQPEKCSTAALPLRFEIHSLAASTVLISRELELATDLILADNSAAASWLSVLSPFLAAFDVAAHSADDALLIALAGALGTCLGKAGHDADAASMRLLWQVIAAVGTAVRVVACAFAAISGAPAATLMASMREMMRDGEEMLANLLCRRQHDSQWEIRESLAVFLGMTLQASACDLAVTAACMAANTAVLQRLRVALSLWELTQDHSGFVQAAAWGGLTYITIPRGTHVDPDMDIIPTRQDTMGSQAAALLATCGGSDGFFRRLAEAIRAPDPIPGRAAVRLLCSWLACRHPLLMLLLVEPPPAEPLPAVGVTAARTGLTAALLYCLEEEDWTRKGLVLDLVDTCLLLTPLPPPLSGYRGGNGMPRGGKHLGDGNGHEPFFAFGAESILRRSLSDPDRPVRLK